MFDCGLMLFDREIGRTRWSRDDNKVDIWASCPFEEEYIYRAYLGTDSEPGVLYLGIMLPERGRFIVSKNLPYSKCSFLFENSNVSSYIERSLPEESARETPLPFSFSDLKTIAELPEGSFIDNIFGRSSGLYAEAGGKKYYVAPFEVGQELIPSAFFCLLTFFKYKGRGYCVLCVDEDGNFSRIAQ